MHDYLDYFEYEDSDSDFEAADAADFKATVDEAYHNDCMDLGMKVATGLLTSIA